MSVEKPDFILYAQHGWADNNRAILDLAQKLATPKTLAIAPSLGYYRTWLRIQPLIEAVEKFTTLEETLEPMQTDEIIQRLQSLLGMRDAHQRDFHRAKAIITLKDGSTIRLWWNPVGVEHVFIASPQGEFLYGGFVGWIHAEALRRTLREIKQEYASTAR
jgi:hypothetical protein